MLAVLTARVSVPIDSEPLAVVEVGVPIGLGIYLAWSNRDHSAATRQTGFAAPCPMANRIAGPA